MVMRSVVSAVLFEAVVAVEVTIVIAVGDGLGSPGGVARLVVAGRSPTVRAPDQARQGDGRGQARRRGADRDVAIDSTPSGLEVQVRKRYAVVVSASETSYGVHAPDVDGCIAVA